MEYEKVDSAKVNEIWDSIESWVDIARGVNKTYSVEDIKSLCCNGKIDLWIVKKNEGIVGFLIGSISYNPQGKVYDGAWLGGEDLIDWVAKGLKTVEKYAVENDCVGYSFIGRMAWKKLLDLDYVGQYFYKNLK